MAGPLTPVVDGRLRHGPHFNAKGPINPQLTLWESILPECCLGLPGDLAEKVKAEMHQAVIEVGTGICAKFARSFNLRIRKIRSLNDYFQKFSVMVGMATALGDLDFLPWKPGIE